jgi:hypothetical protein
MTRQSESRIAYTIRAYATEFPVGIDNRNFGFSQGPLEFGVRTDCVRIRALNKPILKVGYESMVAQEKQLLQLQPDMPK